MMNKKLLTLAAAVALTSAAGAGAQNLTQVAPTAQALLNQIPAGFATAQGALPAINVAPAFSTATSSASSSASSSAGLVTLQGLNGVAGGFQPGGFQAGALQAGALQYGAPVQYAPAQVATSGYQIIQQPQAQLQYQVIQQQTQPQIQYQYQAIQQPQVQYRYFQQQVPVTRYVATQQPSVVATRRIITEPAGSGNYAGGQINTVGYDQCAQQCAEACSQNKSYYKHCYRSCSDLSNYFTSSQNGSTFQNNVAPNFAQIYSSSVLRPQLQAGITTAPATAIPANWWFNQPQAAQWFSAPSVAQPTNVNFVTGQATTAPAVAPAAGAAPASQPASGTFTGLGTFLNGFRNVTGEN